MNSIKRKKLGHDANAIKPRSIHRWGQDTDATVDYSRNVDEKVWWS